MSVRPRVILKTALILLPIFALVAFLPYCYKLAKIFWYSYHAENALANGSWNRAYLYSEHVRNLNPNHDTAIGIMAQLSVKDNHPSALLWLARWVELKPEDPVRQAALGKYAILQDQLNIAQVCLGNLKNNASANILDIIELESALLVKSGKSDQAQILLEKVAAQPNVNPQLLLNYGILLISQNQVEAQNTGIEVLHRLSAQPEFLLPAAENLIRYAIDQQNEGLARKYTSLLTSKDDLPLQKFLLTIEVELFFKKSLPDSFYSEIGRRLDLEPHQLSRSIIWLIERGQEQMADQLLSRYRKQPGKNYTIDRLFVLRCADQGQWKWLLESLVEPEWEHLGPLRYALMMQARMLTSETQAGSSKNTIARALQLELRQHPYSIFEIDELAKKWNWQAERIDLWHGLQQHLELPVASLQLKFDQALQARDTIRLYGISKILLQHFPEHSALRNNFIVYGLLLDQDLELLLQTSEENLSAHPEVAACATTYALALIKNNQPSNALELFARFAPTELKTPPLATYYAITLIANGKIEQAQQYVATIDPSQLLPEEQQLLQMDTSISEP